MFVNNVFYQRIIFQFISERHRMFGTALFTLAHFSFVCILGGKGSVVGCWSFDVAESKGKLEAGQHRARLVRQEQTEAARAPPGRPHRKRVWNNSTFFILIKRWRRNTRDVLSLQNSFLLPLWRVFLATSSFKTQLFDASNRPWNDFELSKLASCLPDVKSGKSVSAVFCLVQEASCATAL